MESNSFAEIKRTGAHIDRQIIVTASTFENDFVKSRDLKIANNC